MKPGDKVRIEIPKSESLKNLEKERVAGVRLILKSSAMTELEGRELTLIKFSSTDNFAIVKTPEGDEHEVHKDFLKEIKRAQGAPIGAPRAL